MKLFFTIQLLCLSVFRYVKIIYKGLVFRECEIDHRIFSIKPPRGLIYFKHFREWGLNKIFDSKRGVIREGGGLISEEGLIEKIQYVKEPGNVLNNLMNRKSKNTHIKEIKLSPNLQISLKPIQKVLPINSTNISLKLIVNLHPRFQDHPLVSVLKAT